MRSKDFQIGLKIHSVKSGATGEIVGFKMLPAMAKILWDDGGEYFMPAFAIEPVKIGPLEWWQVIELATVRELSEMRAAETRRSIERRVATLAAIGEPRYQSVSR